LSLVSPGELGPLEEPIVCKRDRPLQEPLFIILPSISIMFFPNSLSLKKNP
jgi:hypothetical protein